MAQNNVNENEERIERDDFEEAQEEQFNEPACVGVANPEGGTVVDTGKKKLDVKKIGKGAFIFLLGVAAGLGSGVIIGSHVNVKAPIPMPQLPVKDAAAAIAETVTATNI